MRHNIGVYAPLNTYDMSFGFRKSISSADLGIYKTFITYSLNKAPNAQNADYKCKLN